MNVKEQNVLLKGFATNTSQNVQISAIFLLKTHFIFKDYKVFLQKELKTL